VRGPYRVQATFAAEQMADELAYVARMDPYAFRLQNAAKTDIDPHQRWRTVLMDVAALSNWQQKVAASNLSSANVVTGRGISFGFDHGTVVAAVAEIEVNKKTGKIVAKKIWCSVDPGLAIYPDGIQNNLEGDIIMATSRVLVEQLAFDRQAVTGLDWVTYPIMRFKDTPKVSVKLLSRPEIPDSTAVPTSGTAAIGATATAAGASPGSHTGGGGEASASATVSAIANAFFDATGVRLREAPMTPARVRGALKAGVN
jgi:CO/xanthine dehydrogenase Mo-binding subunit